METVFKTKCPYCNTTNCYDSGFTVECVNIHCSFYSKTQHTLVLQHLEEKKKKLISELNLNKSSLSEDTKQKEFEDEDDINHYGYGAWFGPRI